MTTTPLQLATPAVIVEGDGFVRVVPRELTTELIDTAADYARAAMHVDSALPVAPAYVQQRVVDRRQKIAQRKWDELAELVSIEFRDRDSATAFIMAFVRAIDDTLPA